MVPYLSEAEVRGVLHMPELIREMERALAAYSGGEVAQPVRTVVEVGPGRGFFGVMPAHARTLDSLGAKLVTVFEGNLARGLPSHLATIILLDPATGAPLAIMDGRYITEVRTAAVSAVSVRCLARKGASRVAILGSGVQARSHVKALREVMTIGDLTAWSPTRENLEAFAAECGAAPADGAREAVEGADVVVLVTAARQPVAMAEWVKPGAHVIAVGSCRPNHQEVDPVLVRRARLFVDSRAAAVVEAGDIVMAGAEASIAGELGDVIAGRVEGRRSASEITMFKSLGLAVEDLAAARLVLGRANARQAGSV